MAHFGLMLKKAAIELETIAHYSVEVSNVKRRKNYLVHPTLYVFPKMLTFARVFSLARLLPDVSWSQTPSYQPIVALHGQSIRHKRLFPLLVLLPSLRDAADLDKPEVGLEDGPGKKISEYIAMKLEAHRPYVSQLSH